MRVSAKSKLILAATVSAVALAGCGTASGRTGRTLPPASVVVQALTPPASVPDGYCQSKIGRAHV